MTSYTQHHAVVLAETNPREYGPDDSGDPGYVRELYWQDAVIHQLNRIPELEAQIESMKEQLQFVERWANHHGVKPHVTAKEALSMIQHYPPIKQITRSYEDGLVPDTPSPFELVPKLLLVLEQAESSLSDYHQNKEFGHSDLMILQGVREVIAKATRDNQ